MRVDQGTEVIRGVELTGGDEMVVLRGYGIYCGIINKGRRTRGFSKKAKKAQQGVC